MISNAGKATAQDVPQARGHDSMNAVPGPVFMRVATADTMADIRIEIRSGASHRA